MLFVGEVKIRYSGDMGIEVATWRRYTIGF